MATAYHRDDAGAPALTAGTAAGLGFIALKEVLKACLVNGYGAKPSAGWELIYEDTTRIALRNGSHSGYVGFSHSADRVWVSVSETYTGFTSTFLSGDGSKSGTATTVTVPQRLNSRYLVYGVNSYTWEVVADAKTFVLNWPNGGTYSSGIELVSADSGNQSVAFYAGEDSAGNFIAAGGENTTHSTISYGYFSYQGFTALRNPNTGLLVGDAALDVATPGLENTPTVNSRVTALSKAPLSPAVWAAGGVVAGNLRGIALCPEIARLYTSHAAQSLGFTGAMTTRNANTPINLGDGHSYFASPSYYSSCRLITDSPEFW